VSAKLEDAARKSAAWLAGQYRHGLIPPPADREVISPAETIVLDCLRALQAIPDGERLYAHELTDVIAKGYLDTALDARDSRRRVAALLRISAEAA
jgi:hypothetical protein